MKKNRRWINLFLSAMILSGAMVTGTLAEDNVDKHAQQYELLAGTAHRCTEDEEEEHECNWEFESRVEKICRRCHESYNCVTTRCTICQAEDSKDEHRCMY